MQSYTLYTIGHGNRRSDDFIALLKGNAIEILVDIRARPVSGRFPHFNEAELRASLEKMDITYHWAGRQLGGLRRPLPDSANQALVDDSLRGFADYMQTAEFERAATQLIKLSRYAKSALLCAEKDPAFCHRSLIADYLVLRGLTVLHILEDGVQEHCLRAEARKESAELIYDHGVTASLPFNPA